MSEQIFTCPYCNTDFQAELEVEMVECPSCSSFIMLTDRDSVEIGDLFGEFQIIQKLGRNNFGAVFLAYHSIGESSVIINILAPSLESNPDSFKEFISQTVSIADFPHPNIISFYDSKQDSKIAYNVTPYILGNSLLGRLNDSIFLEEEAIRIGLQITEILRAGNRTGFIYGELNPGNVYIDGENNLSILNLGIKLFHDNDTYNQIYHLYYSPEQTRGEQLIWSSDQYSLGVLLYHLMVGVPPYDSDKIGKVGAMHTASPFPNPISKNPNCDISNATIALLEKMMGKLPRNRFGSWDELHEALNNIYVNKKENIESSNIAFPSGENSQVKLGKGTGKFKTLKKGSGTGKFNTSKKDKNNKSSENKFNKTMVHKRKLKKKKVNDTKPALIFGIAAVVIILIFLVAKLNNNSNAKDTLLKAEDRERSERKKKNPSYEKVKKLYLSAKHATEGTSYYDDAISGYNRIKKLEKKQKAIKAKFDKEFEILTGMTTKGINLAKEYLNKGVYYKETTDKLVEALKKAKSITPPSWDSKLASKLEDEIIYIKNKQKEILKKYNLREKAKIAKAKADSIERERIFEENKLIQAEKERERIEKLEAERLLKEEEERIKAEKLAAVAKFNDYEKNIYKTPFDLAKDNKFNELKELPLLVEELDLPGYEDKINELNKKRTFILLLMSDAEQIWKKLMGSGDLLEGKLITVGKKKKIIVEIIAGEIITRGKGKQDVDEKGILIDELSEESLIFLIKCLKKELIGVKISNYFIAKAKFNAANKLSPHNETTINFIKEFYKYNMDNFQKLKDAPSTVFQGKELMTEFINNHKNDELFQEILNNYE